MKVPAWLPRAASIHPERDAILTPHGGCSYATLLARAELSARRLAAQGVGPGDRVALLLEPGIAFAEALHGCLLLGAVAVPVGLRLGSAERAVQTAGASLVVEVPLEGPEALDAPLCATHDLDATAAVIHTSGTSGVPKPVELTYGNFRWSALGSALALGLDPDERWCCALPLNHVGGLSILLRSALYATTAIVHPSFEAVAVARSLRDDRATLVSLVPTMLARLLDAGLQAPATLRCALIGGGSLAAPLAVRAREAGIPIAQTYGLTETCSQATTSAIGDALTAGPPLAITQVRIGEHDEILVAGPTVAPATLAPDGFLHTGDLGQLDDRGRLTVTGRRVDTIVTGGENVAPAEVEAVLLDHVAVLDAAVHARADEEWGEAVTASVVLRPGATVDAAELRAFCGERLAGFKIPRAFRFVAELPRTASGKLLRRELA